MNLFRKRNQKIKEILCEKTQGDVRKNKKQSAFTLIELLVVIAIISLLAAVVLVALKDARAKAQDSKTLSEVKELQNALELYANNHNGDYPASGGFSVSDKTHHDLQTVLQPLVAEKYIAQIPVANSGGYISYTTDKAKFTLDASSGRGYTCGGTSRDSSSYMILFKTKKTIDFDKHEIHTSSTVRGTDKNCITH